MFSLYRFRKQTSLQPVKIVNVVYHHHQEFTNPEQVIKKHAPSFGFVDFLPDNIELTLVKHAAYQGKLKKGNVEYAFFKGSRRHWHIPFKTHNYIVSKKPDIIVVEGLVFPLQVIALKLRLGKKTSILVQHHGELPGKGLKKILQRIADKFISGYLFTSFGNATPWINEGIINDVNSCKELPEASTYLKPSGKKESRSALGIAHDEIVYLWVGRLDGNKDPLTVLQGFENYAANRQGAKLFMIYQQDNLLNAVEQRIRQSETLRRSVSLVGYIPHEELESWYSAADFFISASYQEGSGYALLEAIACGCFPVVSNIPAFRKITDNGNVGMLFKKGNPGELTTALEKSRLLQNDLVREYIKQHFENNFSFRKIAEEFTVICRQFKNEVQTPEPVGTNPEPAYRYQS